MAFPHAWARIPLVALAVLAFGAIGASGADASMTRSVKATHQTQRTLTFSIDKIDATAIVAARAELQVSRRALHRWLDKRYRDGGAAWERARRRARGRSHRRLSADRV